MQDSALQCTSISRVARRERSINEIPPHNPNALADLNFLITGCPRSGTRYIAKLLEVNGLRVSHERFRNKTRWRGADEGIVSWVMAVNSTSTPWGPPSAHFNFRKILHQVRHPLDSIESIIRNEPSRSWNFICQHLNDIPNCAWSSNIIHNFTAVGRAARFWVQWNLRAEDKALFTYQMEKVADFDSAVTKNIESVLGITLDKSKGKAFTGSDMGVSTTNKIHMPWLHLHRCVPNDVYADVVCLAERYGYDTVVARAVPALFSSPAQLLLQGKRLSAVVRLWVFKCCQSLHSATNLASCLNVTVL